MPRVVKMPYSHLVLAIPHASGRPHTAIGAKWDEDPVVSQVRDRLTDWFTDELFKVDLGDVEDVQEYCSRLDCDVERLEGESERICRHSLIDGHEDTPAFRNAMLANWYEYRARLLDAAWRGGEYPLIVDCHSFPSDISPDVDVCIGFNNDATRPSEEVLESMSEIFKNAGYRVAYNRPFANAIAPLDYVGHSVMIEVNKSTYLDKTEMHKGEGFSCMSSTIHKTYLRLLGRAPLEYAVDVVRRKSYSEYFRTYLDGVRMVPHGSRTWSDYCRKASPEGMWVLSIEQLEHDYRGLLPKEEEKMLKSDRDEARARLYKEDVDWLRSRYFVPVQHGGVYYFNSMYNYNQLPTRKGQ